MKQYIFIACLFFSAYGYCDNKLNVSGSATLQRPADKLSFNIGVITQDKSVKKAINSNAEKMTPVIEALKLLGLDEHEIKTGTYSVNPLYAPTPKNPPADWKAAITGYEVRNTLHIETRKLELAGLIFDTASRNGANTIDNISFSLSNDHEAKTEAIKIAVAEARSFAETAAKASGVTLEGVHELTINPAMATPRFQRTFALQEASTPITAGDVEVSANVSIVYEIK